MRTRSIPLSVTVNLLAMAGCLAAALLIVPPAAVAPHIGLLRNLVIAAVAALAALVLPANAIIISSFVAFGSAQYVADLTLSIGTASIYGTDLVLGLVVVRAILPRERVPPPGRFGLSSRLIIGAWLAVMTLAAVRGYEAGTAVPSLLRSGSSAIYWPALFFGYGAILRERALNRRLLFGQFICACLGFVGFMILMRLLNHPFERNNHLLGLVPTTAGTFRRDYGLYSAYIIYPILALVAIGVALHRPTHVGRWMILGLVGIAATAATLIRGETYGLLVALILILVLSSARHGGAMGRIFGRRGPVIVGILVVVIGASITLSVVSPRYGVALAERSIPFVHQSTGAQTNENFRTLALHTGIRTAEQHPLGIGILDEEQLTAQYQIDPDLLGHSAPAALLVFGGFLCLITFAGAVLSLCVESLRFPRAAPWFHPVFVGVVALFVVYSFSAIGIVGQSWVMAIGALLLAARFRLPPVEEMGGPSGPPPAAVSGANSIVHKGVGLP